MFKLKIVISTTIFLILLVITSIIKNQTRITEKKLYKLSQQIAFKEKNINDSQLDFYFLTSPAELEKKVEILGLNNYMPIHNSKIFLNFSSFVEIQKKISLLNYQNEKKTKKN
jgi:hypothetical protein